MQHNGDDPQDVPRVVVNIVKAFRRTRKAVTLVHVLVAVVVLLTVAVVSLYVQPQPEPEPQGGKASPTPSSSQVASTPPAAPKPAPTPATGIDMVKYCHWLGFAGGSFSPPALTPYCATPITPAEYRALCREKYGADAVEFRFRTADDPNTGECVDGSGTALGGLHLQNYCATTVKGWSPGARTVRSAVGAPAGWECRVDTDPSVICAAAAGAPNTVAKREGDDWVCAPRPSSSVEASTGRQPG